MIKKRFGWFVLIGILTLLAGGSLASAQTGGIAYTSLPDEAAIYLNDMVFARDTVVLPNEDVRVILPPGTFPDTLILTENGERVRSYRITPQAAALSGMSGTGYAVTWEPAQPDAATRTIKLEYLMSGARWTPTYDMEIVDEQTVNLAFFAEIQSSGLALDETTVYLIAGRVDLSQQVNQVSQVTMNQYAVGYESVELPTVGVGSVEVQHIYPVGEVSAAPGDMLFLNLLNATLPARRLLVWNASQNQSVNVIYKVQNTSEVPLAEGIVRAYQDALFIGSDFIETTPPASEGSVTVGSLPDVRVRRTESQEYQGSYYQHTVTLEINNFNENELALMVLDRWEDGAWEFEYSLEPARQPDNLLRWEITIPSGESLTITYQFRTK